MRSLLSKWILLTFASGFAAAFGVFATYLTDGFSIVDSLSLAWPVGLIAGGIGAFVIIGPIAAIWTGVDIFAVSGPNDLNSLIFLFSMPSLVALLVLGNQLYFAGPSARPGTSWIIVPILAALAYTAILLLGIAGYLPG